MVKSMSRGIVKEIELKNLERLRGFLPLKKTITQLLILVSIFSLVFSWSSLCSSTLVHYQNLHYFSINSFHLGSIATNKNCIFLICNGILVFLAKTSNLDNTLHKRIGDSLQVETEAEILPDKPITSDQSELIIEEIKADQEFEHSNERAVQVLISIAESDEEEGREIELQNCCLFDDLDEEESNNGEVEEIEELSDDELNQKFEDFIRRMKEEFRVNEYQQQRQLVAVK